MLAPPGPLPALPTHPHTHTPPPPHNPPPTPHPPQRHMVDTNQCKVLYEDNEDEYDEYYDYGEEEEMPQGGCTPSFFVPLFLLKLIF